MAPKIGSHLPHPVGLYLSIGRQLRILHCVQDDSTLGRRSAVDSGPRFMLLVLRVIVGGLRSPYAATGAGFAGRSANRTLPMTRNKITSIKFLWTPCIQACTV